MHVSAEPIGSTACLAMFVELWRCWARWRTGCGNSRAKENNQNYNCKLDLL